MSTGETMRIRAGMKPIATVPRALRTIDTSTGEAAEAHHQRSDVCAVPAAGVVAEAMVALVLADAVCEKFGGDSVSEVKRNIDSYLESIPSHLRVAGQSRCLIRRESFSSDHLLRARPRWGSRLRKSSAVSSSTPTP